MAAHVQHAVRLIDIAQQAGVSQITVSKVLHNRGGKNTRVSEETAQKIRKIAAKLNYRPNQAARQLAGERSYLIGGILDSHANETYNKRLITMERMAAEHGYRLIVGYSHDDVDRIMGHIDDFLGRGVDGVVCLSHTYPGYGQKIATMLQGFKNCVCIERPVGGIPLSFVQPDYVETGYLITRHLLSLGRRRPAFFLFGSEYQTVQDERQGYLKALQEAEVPFDERLLIKQSEQWDAAQTEIIKDLIQVKPDAVIVPNDGVAMWAIRILSDLGIRVPDDLAVVSVDGWEIGKFYRPSITSIDLRSQDVGIAAIEMLLEDIGNPDRDKKPRNSIIVPRLILGESCGGGKRSGNNAGTSPESASAVSKEKRLV